MTERVFTQREAVAAYKALERIKSQQMSWKLSYWVTKLRQKLQAQVEFQQECEIKLVEKYGATVDENGRVQLKTKEEAKAFDNEWAEIGNIQLTDLKITPAVVTEAENLKISPEDMEALDGFVEFDMPEDTAEEPEKTEDTGNEPIPIESARVE